MSAATAKRLAALAGIFLAACGSLQAAQSIGDTLPPRAPGGLDIHHINTGEGNAAFLVLPDGTTI